VVISDVTAVVTVVDLVTTPAVVDVELSKLTSTVEPTEVVPGAVKLVPASVELIASGSAVKEVEAVMIAPVCVKVMLNPVLVLVANVAVVVCAVMGVLLPVPVKLVCENVEITLADVVDGGIMFANVDDKLVLVSVDIKTALVTVNDKIVLVTVEDEIVFVTVDDEIVLVTVDDEIMLVTVDDEIVPVTVDDEIVLVTVDDKIVLVTVDDVVVAQRPHAAPWQEGSRTKHHSPSG